MTMDELKQDGIDLDGREELARTLFAWDVEEHDDPAPTWDDLTEDQRNVWRSGVGAIVTAGWRSPAVVAGLVAEVESLRGLAVDQDLVPVAGHPDDDECTHRSDGTDATYCGQPAAAHDAVVRQMKADPEQSARAYRDVWRWCTQAAAERDEARAEVERLRGERQAIDVQHDLLGSELDEWQGIAAQAREDRDLFEAQRDEANRRLGAVAALADEFVGIGVPTRRLRTVLGPVSGEQRCHECGGPADITPCRYGGTRCSAAALGPVSGAVEGAGVPAADVDPARYWREIAERNASERDGWRDAFTSLTALPVAGHEQEVRAEEAVRPCEECGVEVHVEDGWWRDDSGNAHELIDDDKDDCMCGVYEYPMGEHPPPCPLAARASGSSAPVQGDGA